MSLNFSRYACVAILIFVCVQVTAFADSLYFPYLADGKLSDGSAYTTSLIVYNAEKTTNACDFTTFGLGSSTQVNLRDNSTRTISDGTTFTFTLAINGWQVIRTPGTATFRSALAFLECDGYVTSQAIYTALDPSGRKISETPILGIGIEDGFVLSDHYGPAIHVAADLRYGEQLGLAITNIEDHAISLTVALRTEADVLVKDGTISIPAASFRVAFVNELLGTTIPSNFSGRVVIYSNDAALAANQLDKADSFSLTALRYSGTVFATIPAAACRFQSKNCPEQK